MRGTLIQSAHFPDWKTQPAPGSQPSMPDALTAPARPAFHVFDDLHFDVSKAKLPVEADTFFSGQPIAGAGLGIRIMNNMTIVAGVLILLFWLWLEMRLRRRSARFPWLIRLAGLAGAVVFYVVMILAVAIPFGRDF